MPLFGWFHQMRNRDSVLNALNGHFDHGRTEIKKILPKISFTISLQMRSKLLLLSQHYTFSLKLGMKQTSRAISWQDMRFRRSRY
ncbi:hypothetical protein E1A91_D09G280500v1 [Gossypium mustelinum]|uniref:Uncharacterized protein n=1 Tax=Gossypium mustelinum TaxID=34275 RepID=A0A5D2TPJ6_GOSMU|nr:hypothetical protein E1A91_D09G280500v1 [Gossypium mustelinum]